MKTSFKIYQKRNKLILITRTNGKAKWYQLNKEKKAEYNERNKEKIVIQEYV